MQVKIGQINFYRNSVFGDTGKYRLECLIKRLNEYSKRIQFEYCDCQTEECDVVFYSLYDRIENLEKIVGNPLLIYWTDENAGIGANEIHDDPFHFYKKDNLSISFYDDSSDNIFLPFFFTNIDDYIYTKNNLFVENPIKDKFATFCASNLSCYNAKLRTEVVKYISSEYKEVTCCGSVLNNTNGKLLGWSIEERFDFHRPYKFNICFENMYSSGNMIYMTEKLLNAFAYQTIPIYWGAERVNEIINPNSYINCNDKSFEQILSEIKYFDENEDAYYDMLNTYPFVYDLDDYLYDLFKKIYDAIVTRI